MRFCFEAYGARISGISRKLWGASSRNIFHISEGVKRVGHVPKGVLLRTALRKRSPELTADSCGNLCIRRSACVPLPTPGAPTSMIRAARLNSLVAILYYCLFVYTGAERRLEEKVENIGGGSSPRGRGRSSQLLQGMRKVHGEIKAQHEGYVRVIVIDLASWTICWVSGTREGELYNRYRSGTRLGRCRYVAPWKKFRACLDWGHVEVLPSRRCI